MLRYLGSHSARAVRNSLKRTRPGSRSLQTQQASVDRLTRSYANDDVTTVIRPLASREFSSASVTPPVTPWPLDNRDLQRLTNSILYAGKTPLGTMTTAQWDDTLLAMLYWFRDGDGDKGDDKGFLPEGMIASTSSTDHVKATGFVVDVVDRLLHRLIYEHATQSVAARHRADDLAQWTLAVLGAWLEVGQDFPASKMPVERSDKLWAKIIAWRDQGLYKDKLPVQELARLVQAWLTLQSPEGTKKAADLLLSDHVGEFLLQGDHTIIPCFHRALEQSIQFAESCGDLSSTLMGRMKELSLEPGWEAIQPNEEAVQSQLLDSFLRNGNAADNQKGLSSFETQALQRKMLKLLNEAGDEDTEKVDDVIERWNAIETGQQLTNEITQALFEYYARIGDPRKATSWLFKYDQMGVHHDQKSKQFERLIHLWSESDLPDAAWRSEELLPRLEELVLRDGGTVDTLVYSSIARLWLSSGDVRSNAKVQELVSRAKTVDASLLQVSLDASLESSKFSVGSVTQATNQFMQLWDELDEKERSGITADTARVIAKGKLAPKGIELVQFLVKKGIVPSTAVCENLTRAFSATSEPSDVILLIDLLEGCGASLSFDCYRSAIISVNGTRNKHWSSHTKDILTRLLDKVCDDNLEAAPKEIGEVLAIVLDSFADVQRELDAMETLRLAEKKLLTPDRVSAVSPVPLACFQSVMSVLVVKGELPLVAELFDRVWGYYRMGYTDLLPDANFYMIYLTALAKEGERSSTLDKREEMLNQLIQLYESTGREECKPSDRMFNSIYSPKTEATEEHVQRAISLLDKMIALDVEIQDAYAFNTAMNLILESKSNTAYRRVLDIAERMEKAGVSADSYTLLNILRACGRAREQERQEALNKAMAILGEIRRTGRADTRTYNLVFRILGELLPSRDSKMLDPLVEAIFQLCCDDGSFTKNIRFSAKYLTSPTKWKEIYERHLLGGAKEPDQWSRNVNVNSIKTR
jgi:hypothetical protein